MVMLGRLIETYLIEKFKEERVDCRVKSYVRDVSSYARLVTLKN
jgi:hypothetical protein